MNSKYKVGDVVKVRQDLVIDEHYGETNLWFCKYASKYKTITITEVCNDGTYLGLGDDGLDWAWDDEMLDGLVEQTVEPTNREIMDKLLEIEDRFNQFSVQFGFKYTNSARGWERQVELDL